MIALGGGDLVGVPDRPPMTSADFEVLWQFLQDAPPLDTSSLKVFEGEWSKYEKAIKEKDEAIALAEAYKAYSRISAIFMAIFGFFFFRAMMLPRFLGFLLLNYPGPHDEILSLLAAYVLKPNKVMLCEHRTRSGGRGSAELMGRLHDLKQAASEVPSTRGASPAPLGVRPPGGTEGALAPGAGARPGRLACPHQLRPRTGLCGCIDASICSPSRVRARTRAGLHATGSPPRNALVVRPDPQRDPRVTRCSSCL